MAVATEDLGMAVDEGFYLFGRVQGAEAKGCSLAVEEFIQLAKGNSIMRITAGYIPNIGETKFDKKFLKFQSFEVEPPLLTLEQMQRCH